MGAKVGRGRLEILFGVERAPAVAPSCGVLRLPCTTASPPSLFRQGRRYGDGCRWWDGFQRRGGLCEPPHQQLQGRHAVRPTVGGSWKFEACTIQLGGGAPDTARLEPPEKSERILDKEQAQRCAACGK